MSEIQKTGVKQVLCKVCQQVTNHNILNAVTKSVWWEDADAGERHDFYTLQCLGCENVCLLVEYSHSEDTNPYTGEPVTQSRVYPSPNKDDRDVLDRIHHVPESVRTAYEETVKAINSGLVLLTAMGVRLVIEAVCNHQKITGGNLEKKINKMQEIGLITPSDAKLLHLVREIGNQSAHEMKKQKREALSLSMDIIEGVIRQLYIHPKEAEALSSRSR